ncbi:MAG: DUF3147 family protein [Spirochaetes bacterium]|nr:DUF3147 family protein [Spirochaetota bacterium]
MIYFLKIIISALLIFIISEISKKYPKVGGLIASLPLVSLISILWLFYETRDKQKVIDYCNSIYIYIFPSIFIFIFLPIFLKLNINFYISLLISSFICIIFYSLVYFILNKKFF